MFGNHKVADFIAAVCMQVDLDCRKELQHGQIVSERDYVSVLAARIRDELRRLRITAYSQTANPSLETRNGIDAMIVFRFKNEVKIGLYEAKWPRVKQRNYPWDYLEGTSNVSHFSDQIERQKTWSDSIAIWEMFFNEGPWGFSCPPYDTFGSSCVWHPNAYKFRNLQGLIYKPWTTSKLKQLLDMDGLNFYSIIYDILTCRKGRVFSVDLLKTSVSIPQPRESKDFFEVPIPRETESDVDERVEAFMVKENIETYLYLDINSPLIPRNWRKL